MIAAISKVTGFVLVFSLAENISEDRHPPGSFARILEWLEEQDFGAPAEVAEKYAAGFKHPPFYLYTAGYHYFPEDEFIAFFCTLTWQCPENVVLCLQPEEGATRVIRPHSVIDERA